MDFIDGRRFVRIDKMFDLEYIYGYWKSRVVAAKAIGIQVLAVTLEGLSYKRSFCSATDLAEDIQEPRQRGESGC